MGKTVEFYFDLGSPTAYLACTQLPAIAERAGAKLEYRPMLLGGVFQAIGSETPVNLPPRGAYMSRDIPRCAAYYGVPYNANPHFPVNTLQVMRGAIVAQEDGELERYMDTVNTAIWVDQKDMSQPEVIAETLQSAGLDAEKYAARMQDPAVKETLKTETAAAVKRGVFGAPTMFVGDEMFFGQDRLDYVERALAA